jgi:hypothetical protein
MHWLGDGTWNRTWKAGPDRIVVEVYQECVTGHITQSINNF